MTDNLLVIDVGNTNTVLGVFEGKDLRAQWRLKTDKSQTADDMVPDPEPFHAGLGPELPKVR